MTPVGTALHFRRETENLSSSAGVLHKTKNLAISRCYATGRLEDSGRQNDENMSRKIGNAQSRATFFRHSAVLSLPAVLLRKLVVRDLTQQDG